MADQIWQLSDQPLLCSDKCQSNWKSYFYLWNPSTLCHSRSHHHVCFGPDGNWTTTGPNTELACAYLSTFADTCMLLATISQFHLQLFGQTNLKQTKTQKHTQHVLYIMMYLYSFTSAGHTLSKCSSILSLLVDKTWKYAEHCLYSLNTLHVCSS